MYVCMCVCVSVCEKGNRTYTFFKAILLPTFGCYYSLILNESVIKNRSSIKKSCVGMCMFNINKLVFIVVVIIFVDYIAVVVVVVVYYYDYGYCWPCLNCFSFT